MPAGPTGPTTVILEADGQLPEPVSDALDGPPRVYVDLNGVTPGESIGPPGTDALVRRTRVALHSGTPLVTRVVFDLSKRVPYRIDDTARAQGRLVVVLGAAGSASVAIPNATTAPAARAKTPVVPRAPLAKPPRPLRETPGRAEAYAAQVSAVVERLRTLRPVLVAIDRRSQAPAELAAAATEFDAIGQMLTAMKPPRLREATNGLLVRACVLGARASRMWRDSIQTADTSAQMNAASAAAGALLLLDRATSDLGL